MVINITPSDENRQDAQLFLAFVKRDCLIWGGGTGLACQSGPPRDPPSWTVSFSGSGH